MKLNIEELKNSLTIEQVETLIADLGGEPRMKGDMLICKTICHGGTSHKLYYYGNTHLLRCYTDCPEDAFDIFELVIKIKKLEGGGTWSLPKAASFVARFFGIDLNGEENFENNEQRLADWEILKNHKQIGELTDNKKIIEFKNIDEDILKHLPRPRILPWEDEEIDPEVMTARGICYNPISQAIVIPHYDEYGQLIGIRERTLIKEEERNGKYKPAIINGVMYNHPLGFSLYNLNNSWEAIASIQKAIVFEAEKSTLKYASHFGMSNDISVATCGSNLIQHQVDLLMEAGAQEIVIAFDRQYKEIGDEEYKRWTKKLTEIHKKYSPKVDISFIFDKEYRLDYKASPIDQGAELFKELFKERIRL